jgi:ech hydrogenase subunit D
MNPQSPPELINTDALQGRIQALRERGHRLVQIGATRLPERVEVTYSLDLAGQLTNLRVHLDPIEPKLPSISSIYACAVLYENEMHDLFKIKVEGLALDFHGNFYKTSVKFPFGTVKAPPAKPAPASAAKPAAVPAQKTAPAP